MLFDKLDTAKMHGLDTSNVSSRVEVRRDEQSGIWAIALTWDRLREPISTDNGLEPVQKLLVTSATTGGVTWLTSA